VSWSHRWRITLKEQVDKHRKRLSDGLQRSIELHAMESTAPERSPTYFVDNHSDKEAKDFAAWVPEFFETYAEAMLNRAPRGQFFLTNPRLKPSSASVSTISLRYIYKEPLLFPKNNAGDVWGCVWNVCGCWAKACRQDSAALAILFSPFPIST
jgi:hypothetical protein